MRWLGGVIFCLVTLGLTAVQTAGASDNAMVSMTTVINASPEAVYKAIRLDRTSDPSHRKLLSTNGSDFVMSETFDCLPLIGTAHCIYKEHETPQRIQYHMISSDKLLAFDGAWEITPCQSENLTRLTLSTHIETGIKLPFSKKVTRDITTKTISQRISEVRQLAELKEIAILPR